MAKTTAVYYRAPDGSEPVSDFIESLTLRRQVAIDNQIDRLNDLDPAAPPLPFPHSSRVEGELRELPCHYGSEQYRILYRRSRNLFALLHAFRRPRRRCPGPRSREHKRGGWTSGAGWMLRADGGPALPVTTRRELDRWSRRGAPFTNSDNVNTCR